MALLEEEVVCGGGCVVLVGEQALAQVLCIIAQPHCLLEDVVVNRDAVLAH